MECPQTAQAGHVGQWQDSEYATTAPVVKVPEADCSTLPTAWGEFEIQRFSLLFWGEVEIQRFSALSPSGPLPSTVALHERRHKHFIWLQKKLFIWDNFDGSEGGAQCQSVPWHCNYAAEIVLLSNLACFLDVPQINLCCSLGCSCPIQKVQTVLGDSRISSTLLNCFDHWVAPTFYLLFLWEY